MNRGDAQYIMLNINVDGSPIEEGYADDIELTFNAFSSPYCVRKSLSDETIEWDEAEGRYSTFLDQEDTFKFKLGENTWQLRLLKNNQVVSTSIGTIVVGGANSKEVL